MGKFKFFLYFLLIGSLVVFIGSRTITNSNQTKSPYEEYYYWYTKEIAPAIERSLKKLDNPPPVTENEFLKVKSVFENAYQKAHSTQLPDEDLAKVHNKLIKYLEYRIIYAEGFILYLQTKDRDQKALVNNYNDEGNISYAQFISYLEEYAVKHDEEFVTPLFLY